MLDFRYFIFISSSILQFLISTIYHTPLYLYSYNYYLTSIIYISYLFFLTSQLRYRSIDRFNRKIQRVLLNNSTLYLRNFFIRCQTRKEIKTDCAPLYCLSQRFVRPLCFAATRLLIFIPLGQIALSRQRSPVNEANESTSENSYRCL